MPALEPNAVVVRHEELPGCLFRLWVRPDWDLANTEWEAGQFLRFGVPTGEDTDKKNLRALSMVSIDEGVIELYVVAVENGTVSPKLAALREGDRCYAEEKLTGHFTAAHLPTESGDHLWMFGTGAGVAPYMCMLRHSSEHLVRYTRIIVVHTVRESEYLSFGEELVQMAQKDARIRYIPIVTRSENRVEVRDGHWALRERIPTLLESGVLERASGTELTTENSTVMLCGNPEMIKEMAELLKTRDLGKHTKRRPGQVVSERYW